MSILKKILPKKRPRLVAVTIVRDEEDIIEPFVRHTAAFVDHHLIADHCSHDQTPDILLALQREGLPLSLYRSQNPVYLQPPLTNHLIQRALNEFDADWILPIDGDEFIGPANPDLDLHSYLESLSPDHPCLRFLVKNYFPHHDDNPTDPNPATRLRHRTTQPTPPFHKIILHRSLAAEPNTRIGAGNHDYRRGNEHVPDFAQDELFLAHFPNRSPSQIAGKIALAELGKDAFGSKRKGIGTHRTEAFKQLKADPKSFLAAAPVTPDHELTKDPFSYRGGKLTLTPPLDQQNETRLARLLLHFSHDIVKRHAELVLKNTDSKNPLYDSDDLMLEDLSENA
ncbi:MAG: glycosyltransferase family 2 protein [Verrucomicrobiota bacterium]